MKQKIIIAGASLLTLPCVEAENKLPNIVVFLADDLGRSESEPYGAITVRTPNMARLAREGMTFERAFVAAPYSGPSRASLFSGVMPPRHGEIANQYVPRMDMMTMVKSLQNQGYEVVSLGKTTHGFQLARRLGFDFLVDDMGEHPKDDRLVIKPLEKFLAAPRSGKPLCVFVGDRRPHSPWLNESIYDVKNDPSFPNNLIDTPEARSMWGRYLTDVTNMDKTRGDVEKRFEEYFGNDDFLFMFTSDHGTSWMFRKGNLYDGAINIPLIVKWKGKIKENVRSTAMVSWIDIIPTFLDIAGAKPDTNIDGRSFKKVLFGEADTHHKYIFATHNSIAPADYVNRAVRSERFKYIRNYSHENYFFMIHELLRTSNSTSYWESWDEKVKEDSKAKALLVRYRERPYEELYDVIADPMEEKNLAHDPSYKHELENLSSILDEWMLQQQDDLKLPQIVYPLNGPSPYEQREEINQLFYKLKAEKKKAEKLRAAKQKVEN